MAPSSPFPPRARKKRLSSASLTPRQGRQHPCALSTGHVHAKHSREFTLRAICDSSFSTQGNSDFERPYSWPGLIPPSLRGTMVRISLPNRLKSYTGHSSTNNSRSSSPSPGSMKPLAGGADAGHEPAKASSLVLKIIVLKVGFHICRLTVALLMLCAAGKKSCSKGQEWYFGPCKCIPLLQSVIKQRRITYLGFTVSRPHARRLEERYAVCTQDVKPGVECRGPNARLWH